MLMKTDIFLLIPLLMLAGCGGETPKSDGSPPTSQSAPAPANADDRPPVYLEGLYATSSNPRKEVYDLFDNDPATGWQTKYGAGPDEGIMLYFTNALPLQSVRIIAEEENYHGGDDFVQVYVNGTPGASGKPGENIPLGEKPVKALYLRFVKTGLEKTVSRSKDGAEIQLKSFPADAFIGIKELTVFNDKGKPVRLVAPDRIRGTLTTSSTLEPEQAYSPANLFDARKEFVWVEGNKNTAGEGESITFEFAKDVNISAIQVWNGYQRSDEHFSANARLRDFSFGAGDNAPTYTLRDTKAGQKIALSTPAQGRKFVLKIKSVYPGRKYKDMAISDILFFDGEKPFVLTSELPELYTRELRRKLETSPLDQLLDHRVSNLVNEADVQTEQSLILRSDGTFVLYSADIMPDDTESQTLADGNWELIRSDPATAILKVFGRWNNVSDFIELYKGTTTQDVTRIFSDELVIENNTITGKKLIGTFYIR